jgi:hypothetical protein
LDHEAAKQAGLQGNPWLLQDPLLLEFVELVRNAIALSPLGQNGVPTLEAFAWFEITTYWDTRTTQTLVHMIHQEYMRDLQKNRK